MVQTKSMLTKKRTVCPAPLPRRPGPRGEGPQGRASSLCPIPHPYFPTLGALNNYYLFCTYLELSPSHFIVEFIWIFLKSLLPESSEEVLLFMIVT